MWLLSVPGAVLWDWPLNLWNLKQSPGRQCQKSVNCLVMWKKAQSESVSDWNTLSHTCESPFCCVKEHFYSFWGPGHGLVWGCIFCHTGSSTAVLLQRTPPALSVSRQDCSQQASRHCSSPSGAPWWGSGRRETGQLRRLWRNDSNKPKLAHLPAHIKALSSLMWDVWFSLINSNIFLFFFYFLAMVHNMWDLHSLTRDRTWAPCTGSWES